MNHPFLDTLFAYDRWATRTILEACAELTQEEFERPLDIGPGSLERTLTHLVSAQFFFADRLESLHVAPALREGWAHEDGGGVTGAVRPGRSRFG